MAADQGRIADEAEFWKAHAVESDLLRRLSLKRGFDQLRSVQAYAIRNDVIRYSAPAKEHRSFYPILQKGIVCSLAKVREGDKKAALEFSEEYGLLGHDQLVKRKDFAGGDPLSWLWAHARTLRLCLALMYSTRLKLKDDLRNSLLAIQQSGGDIEEFLAPSISVGILGRVVPLSKIAWGETGGDLAGVAQHLYRDIIVRNIDGLKTVPSPSIDDEDEKQVVYVGRYRSLIQFAYRHLKDADEQQTVRRCKARDCGAFFILDHGANEYCPPWFDERKSLVRDDTAGKWKLNKVESPCALGERINRHRKGPKEAAWRYGSMREYILGKRG